MTQSQKGGKMKGGVLNSLDTMDEMSVASQDSVQDENTEPTTTITSMFSNKNIIIVVLCGLLVLSFLGLNIFLWVGVVVQFIAKKVGVLVTTILEWLGFYTGAVINTSADVVADTAQAGIEIAEGTVHSVGNLLQNRDNVSGPLPEQLQWDAAVFETRPMETENPQEQSYYETDDIVDDVESDLSRVGSGIEEVLKTAEIPVKIDIVKEKPPTLDETINQSVTPKPTEPAPTEPSKTWCLVGEFDGRRSCTQVEQPDMCMSGQLYHQQSDCLDIHPKSSPLYKETNPGNKYKRTSDVVRTQNWGIAPPRPPPAAYAPPRITNQRITNQIPLVQQPPVQYYNNPSLPVPINPYSTPIPMHPMLSKNEAYIQP